MARKFKDVIGQRDLLLSSSADLTRTLAVLPNGVPFWGGASTTMIGAEVPPSINFSVDPFTIEFWFRRSTVTTGNMFVCATIPNVTANSQVVWQIYQESAGAITFYHYNTGNTVARSCTTPVLGNNTTHCVHIICAAPHLSPVIYVNNVLSIASQVGVTGTLKNFTPNVHKLFVRGGASTQGIAEPALYKKALTDQERAINIAAMNAA